MRIVALESLDESNCYRPHEKRIFAIGFLAAPPAWITAEVSIWSANDKTSAMIFAVGIARFVCLDGSCFFNQLRVPGLAQSARLGKLRCRNHRLEAAFPTAGSSQRSPCNPSTCSVPTTPRRGTLGS